MAKRTKARQELSTISATLRKEVSEKKKAVRRIYGVNNRTSVKRKKKRTKGVEYQEPETGRSTGIIGEGDKKDNN
jgi:hypothetical protein